MRVKFIRGELIGTVKRVSDKQGFTLIKKGLAILTKDMTGKDYKLTSDEEQADGHTIKLRSYKHK